MNDVSNFLGNSAARDLGMQYASNRLVARQQADEAFYQGQVTGIHKVRQATAQRIANIQGFNANYMTADQWQGIVSDQTRKWTSELQSDVVGLVANLAAAPLVLAGFGYAGARLIGSGAMKIAQGSFRGAMIHGSSKLAATGTILNGAARIAGGTTLISSGVNNAVNAFTLQNNGNLLSRDGINSVKRVFDGDWGVSLTISQTDLNKTIEGKFILPLYNQDLVAFQMKSPELGAQLKKITSPYLRYDRHEENTSFYVGLNTGSLIGNSSGNLSVIAGNTQEFDIFKYNNPGGFKFATGFRYKSGQSVPSLNVGWELPSKTSINFEFRGSENK